MKKRKYLVALPSSKGKGSNGFRHPTLLFSTEDDAVDLVYYAKGKTVIIGDIQRCYTIERI